MKKMIIFLFIICLLTGTWFCFHAMANKNDQTSVVSDETILPNVSGSYITGKIYKLDTEYIDTLKSSDGSIASFVDLTITHGDKWKEKIKTYYDALYQQLDSEGQHILEQSQSDWEKFNSSDDDLNKYLMDHYESTGGTNSAVNYITLNRSRAVELLEKCRQLGLLLDDDV